MILLNGGRKRKKMFGNVLIDEHNNLLAIEFVDSQCHRVVGTILPVSEDIVHLLWVPEEFTDNMKIVREAYYLNNGWGEIVKGVEERLGRNLDTWVPNKKSKEVKEPLKVAATPWGVN